MDYNKFFTDHPEFKKSPVGGRSPNRMNVRYDRIVGWNRDLLQGKKILDVGAHDGRWSMASLDIGASEARGIEPHGENFMRGVEIVSKYSPKFDNMKLLMGEWQEYEARMFDFNPDVVFLNGIVYHIPNPVGLFDWISDMKPEVVVYDGRIKSAGGIHTKIEGGEGRPALANRKSVVFVPNWDFFDKIRECYFPNYRLDVYKASQTEGEKDYDADKRKTFRLVRE